MAVTHLTALRNTLADAAVDSLDVGTTDAAGDLRFLTAADAEVALLPLSNPAAGAAASGTATFSAITADSSATGNASPITKFELRDRDNTAKIFGSVTATSGGGDIELSSTTVSAGQTVSMTSLTYSAPS